MAAKPIRPRLPFWLLLVASFGPDWLETAEIAFGMSETPLWSHSIPAVVAGAIFAGTAVSLWRRSIRDGFLVAGLYTSHLAVDYITGHKPLGFGTLYLGAHIYDHPIIDFVVESGFVIAGWWWYRRSLPPGAGRSQPAVLPGLLLFLIGMQAVYDRFFAHG